CPLPDPVAAEPAARRYGRAPVRLGARWTGGGPEDGACLGSGNGAREPSSGASGREAKTSAMAPSTVYWGHRLSCGSVMAKTITPLIRSGICATASRMRRAFSGLGVAGSLIPISVTYSGNDVWVSTRLVTSTHS